MSLSDFVAFYSLINKPDMVDSRISGEFILTEKLQPYLQKLIQQKHLGGFEQLERQDTLEEVLETTDLTPYLGLTIAFTYVLDRGNGVDIYKNISDFITIRKSLRLGKFPSEVYLTDEGVYYNGDDECSLELTNIKKQCELIGLLSKLSHYHDTKQPDKYSLVFVQSSESGSTKTVVINPEISLESINSSLDIQPLETLLPNENNPHHYREVGVFRASLIEFLSDKGARCFEHLVKHWSDFLTLYKNNFETYLSGFAFHQAKKEVAQAELSFANEMSKVLGDITGKILGIPLSIVAIITLIKSESVLEQSLLLIGVLIASAIISELVANQSRQVERIKHAQDVFFSGLKAKRDIFPKELVDALDASDHQLSKNQRTLTTTLIVFRGLCWFITILSSILFVSCNFHHVMTTYQYFYGLQLNACSLVVNSAPYSYLMSKLL